jgi:hypothetical protein
MEMTIMGSERLLKQALKDVPPGLIPEGIKGGHTKYIWDPANEIEVTAARQTFDYLRGRGFAAFKAEGAEGTKGAQIFDFDPGAGRMILVPQMRGG